MNSPSSAFQKTDREKGVRGGIYNRSVGLGAVGLDGVGGVTTCFRAISAWRVPSRVHSGSMGEVLLVGSARSQPNLSMQPKGPEPEEHEWNAVDFFSRMQGCNVN